MSLHLFSPETFRPNYPVIWGLLAVFAILLACIAAMWIILAGKKDERRKQLLTKVCTLTFIIENSFLLVDAIIRMSSIKEQGFAFAYPLFFLGISSLLFVIIFLVHSIRGRRQRNAD